MKTENIEKLMQMEKRRGEDNAYMMNKAAVYIREKNLIDVTLSGPYGNRAFDQYMRKAILEKEKELLARGYELEQEDYEETKRLAQIEAKNILES